ncbi:pyridoxal phosphate-dependent decarboxylase family protein [Actinomadura latina]|uniref:Aminotransferase class V-fold PLP-dependent enzyme n=1 Tax=Actinomadura latina TaxID=163603 RepID=A0A846YPY2_9ACTN|nr:pyridoxal-dependent decarboxylase [Actinomadura latina]NKZ02221.1 aminotransferase class V-fold PLP-dependent enzyme [Actinomadura latina]
MDLLPLGRASFDPHPDAAARLWRHVVELLGDERGQIAGRGVSAPVDVQELRDAIGAYGFDRPLPALDVIEDVAGLLRATTVHTTHPRYFGLFNPTPTLLGVVGETLAAAFNPQLAAWSHAPAAAEIEAHLLRFLGGRLGHPQDAVAGSFTSGGAEANMTAVLLALTRTWPDYGERGLRALDGRPVMYASAESHLAWLKIAHATGIGRDAVRLVPTGPDLRMDTARLAERIAADRARGELPFLVVATAGTTSAGIIDPLHEAADLCREQGLRLHADAAYGGAAVLSDRLRPALSGIERADSVTVDAHKWMSVPMGAGAFLCTDREGLAETFRVTTSYMPAEIPDTVDPYTSSQQWSRRFMGLKLFLSLAAAGREGYAEQLERDAALADVLRGGLAAAGWEIVNDTPLPVVCFADPGTATWEHHDALAQKVVQSGRAWISPVRLNGRAALRACLISHRTTAADVEELVRAVGEARKEV